MTVEWGYRMTVTPSPFISLNKCPNVLASNAYGHPYAEGGCHYGDEKTKSSNDLSFK